MGKKQNYNNSDLLVVFITITVSAFNMITSAIQNENLTVLSVREPKNIVSTCTKTNSNTI